MATVPVVTDITAHVATWDASGIIDAFRAHIVATAGTTKLSVDAYNAGEGLTVGFLAGGEAHQTNLRKYDADEILVSIEPTGSITNPGNSTPTAPTGTSADWSGENTTNRWEVDPTGVGAGSKLWCIELDDAFFLLFTNTTNTHHPTALHAGRIAFSVNSAGAVAAGQDGLGWLAGGPYPFASGGWFNNAAGVDNNIHWSTNVWCQGFTASARIVPYANSVPPTAGTAGIDYRPLAPFVINAQNINNVAGTPGIQAYGILKYVRSSNTSQVPKTRIDDVESNQSWMHVYLTNTPSSSPLIIWDKTVTP